MGTDDMTDHEIEWVREAAMRLYIEDLDGYTAPDVVKIARAIYAEAHDQVVAAKKKRPSAFVVKDADTACVDAWTQFQKLGGPPSEFGPLEKDDE